MVQFRNEPYESSWLTMVSASGSNRWQCESFAACPIGRSRDGCLLLCRRSKTTCMKCSERSKIRRRSDLAAKLFGVGSA
jgi:hypothetical protein